MTPAENITETDLPAMLKVYKAAVETWIEAIRSEESMASVDPTLAEVDRWEEAHFAEEEARGKAKAAKKEYEDAIRRLFFHF